MVPETVDWIVRLSLKTILAVPARVDSTISRLTLAVGKDPWVVAWRCC
jgi:hypothetical protein